MKLFKLAIFAMIMLPIQMMASEKINVAISSAPNNLSPFYSTDANSQNLNRLIHISLIDFNEKMQFVCIACEKYSEKMEGKKHVFEFMLKKDLTFSDGSTIAASDVQKSYEYFSRNEDIKSVFMGAFSSIEKLETIGTHQVRITYSSFSLENLSNLSLLKILKLKDPSVKDYTVNNLIGGGDYIIKKFEPLEIELESRRKGHADLVFKVVKDETTLALKIINKEIDVSVANMSPRKVNWLKEQKGISVWERESGNFQFLGINHRREMFKDVRVRRALSLLIPREQILKYKLKETAILSNGMFSPAFADLYEGTKVDSNNVAEAAKLLAEAGWKKIKNGILEKEGKLFQIDWKVSNNKASIEIVDVLEHFFKKEGIIVKITIQEWGTYMSSFKNGNFDVVVGQWIGFTGPDMLRFAFHSTNLPPKGANRTAYINPLLDDLLDRATVETDAKKRNVLYKSAIAEVNNDYAYINLWHPNVIWVGRDCLSAINLEPNGSFYPLKTLEKHCE